MTPDVRRILLAQALRAFAYGFGAVLLGAVAETRGWSGTEVGLLLAAVVTGTFAASLLVGAFADRLGRRRCYQALFLGLAAAGGAFALTDRLPLLVAVALLGTLSTEVVESGPFTSLEQAMLAGELEGHRRTKAFGRYNAIAALAGSLGALAVGAPAWLRQLVPGVPADQRFFALFVVVGLAGVLVARSLSPAVEANPPAQPDPGSPPAARLGPSRGVVVRLAGLFAVDSFAGGFAVQSLLAFFLARRFGVATDALGPVFFALGALQTISFLAASRLAERVGLLPTMVFTHLPSNLFLIAFAFAPTFPLAVTFLLARSLLSQMDVPARQAYVMALVTPPERTAAAAATNSVRYVARPFGPLLAGAAQHLFLGLPFVVAGGLKALYDLTLWRWFRYVPLPEEGERASSIDRPPPADSSVASVRLHGAVASSRGGSR